MGISITATYDVYTLKVEHGIFKNFCYIIIDKVTRMTAIVDPAWELDKIEQRLLQINASVAAVLLTHTHFDHVNLVPELEKRYRPRVYLSREEAESSGYYFGNQVLLEDNQSFYLGQTLISCLLTPGHSEGSMCYLLEDCLFTGDTVFIEGCGFAEAQTGAAGRLYNSIQKIKQNVGQTVLIYPGHSFGKAPGYPLSYLLENNIYFLLETKEHFVQFRTRKGQKGIFRFQ
ncbi:MBL fold metallo-hydrolase [Paenibacillus sp. FSL P4-0502]|uniref:MBL fold metallo-hydrolase n=1 Tax=Paenibacillus sp. FSL P4-0502 TaxID=2975319 RepID=UPI004046FFD6